MNFLSAETVLNSFNTKPPDAQGPLIGAFCVYVFRLDNHRWFT